MSEITNFLTEDSIIMDCDSRSQKNTLEVISNKMAELTSTNKDEIFQKLYEREKLGTTAFGNGIAIPHARVEGIQNAKIIILKLTEAIDFNSIDGNKVDIVMSLFVPNDNNEMHIELLSSIASLLDNQVFREKIRTANTASDVMMIIDSH
jgi:PTS system nitrogen regulatory IIA component|tara:strand:+ start:222 stop:671 length:450 start_codon:yes stop_codon:yes gene_type:complete